MPRDPFADDPHDPASFIEDDEPLPPLSFEERMNMQRDLQLVHNFQQVLSPKGVRGIFFYCEDCEENHYFDWEILASNLKATLNGEPSPVHEPGAETNIHAYVPWDYALGYLDGVRGA